MDDSARRERAHRALDGLSVGDAFGEQAFGTITFIARGELPPGRWRWTDDTAMACSIFETLATQGRIDQDDLARRFATRFTQEPNRGYGAGAVELLERIASGASWREESAKLFGGQGSYGNGAAMRVAPVGAWFADDLERAAEEARRSAAVTHTHVEAQEGAAAVALTTARLLDPEPPRPSELLAKVVAALHPSETRNRLEQAATLDPDDLERGFAVLGTGHRIAAFDTVPFCIWVAAHRWPDWSDALFSTASGFGDVDTTCAIVGGMIAGPHGGPPAEWLARREDLPGDL